MECKYCNEEMDLDEEVDGLYSYYVCTCGATATINENSDVIEWDEE